MNFYTSVARYGNSILYRGYNHQGKRIARKDTFQPTLYIPSKVDEGWTAIDGQIVAPITFDSMRETKEWLQTYDGVSNFNIYGSTNYIHQYITEKFPREIEFDRDKINVSTIDIETKYENGFPDPEIADQEITAITIKNNLSGVYWVWGCKDYDTEAALIKPVRYKKCQDEYDLLLSFLDFISDEAKAPDVITGWNVRFFDIPYLINRVDRILGGNAVKKFSPWGIVDSRTIRKLNREHAVFDIKGVETLDYLELFQKFGYTYGTQESYALNHIAYVVLGERKLSYEESGSLKNLYEDDFQKYIDYNMKDVELVDRLEDKMGLITLAMTMAYKGGVNYQDTFGTTGIWESIIYRKLLRKKQVSIATKAHEPKQEFAGGFVKSPQVGLHEWVVSFDLNSLYPNIIVQWNMSPETVQDAKFNIPGGVDFYTNYFGTDMDPLHPAVREENVAVATNGSTYSKNKDGVIPTIIEEYYNDRKSIKKMMLASQQQYQKNASFELEKEINRYENQQMAIKILMNSLYGALGNKYFKYFDLRVAEGVTLTGQMVIQWAEKAMNKAMNGLIGGDKDYVIAIDTDSLYVNFGPLVDKLKPKNPVEFLDKVCKEHFESVLSKCYEDLFSKMNCHKPRMEMGREVIADRGIWTAKKRYILNVHNSEGVQYAEPKLKIMGIEAIKSSTPQIVRDRFREIFKVIISGSEKDTQEFIRNFKQEFKGLPIESIAFPRSVSNVTDFSDRKTIYKKGTPIHVRGSLLYNKALKSASLSDRYELIQNGTRIKFIYLKLPNTIKENVIAFPEVLPQEFKLHNYIDFDKQFDKTFLDPINIILNAINWKSEEQQTLEDFFA